MSERSSCLESGDFQGGNCLTCFGCGNRLCLNWQVHARWKTLVWKNFRDRKSPVKSHASRGLLRGQWLAADNAEIEVDIYLILFHGLCFRVIAICALFPAARTLSVDNHCSLPVQPSTFQYPSNCHSRFQNNLITEVRQHHLVVCSFWTS